MPSVGSHAKRLNLDLNRLNEQFIVELLVLIKHKLLNIDEMQVKKDFKTNKLIKPKELLKIFETYVDKANEMQNSNLCKSFEKIYKVNSNESIEVINRRDDNLFDDIFHSDDEDMDVLKIRDKN